MIYGSVCSGIEAASVAWKPLGWKAAFFSEIEKFPSSVLDHHYPTVPNLGDMTKFKEWPDAIIDVLVGGTPCQSFSIAGLRKGLDDPRGNLMLTYLAIAARYRPEWLVWENVPGVLSSNGGRDFGTLLGGLGQLGYGFAYRVLDAQYAGVPQRRRRVFVVGHLGDWRRAAAVLFERHSLSGDTPPSREKGQEITGTISSRATAGGGLGTDFETAGGLQAVSKSGSTCSSNKLATGHVARKDSGEVIAFGGNNTAGSIEVATAVNAKGGSGRQDFESETFITHSLPTAYRTAGDGAVYEEGDRTAPLTTGTDPGANVVAFAQNQRDEVRMMRVAGALAAEPGMKQQTYIAQPAIAWSEELTASVDCAGTIQRGGDGGRHDGVMTQNMQVRRLTPRECERLQGFPDDYTVIPGRAADGPRYKALGNSMAVPVMRWIGERITTVNRIEA